MIAVSTPSHLSTSFPPCMDWDCLQALPEHEAVWGLYTCWGPRGWCWTRGRAREDAGELKLPPLDTAHVNQRTRWQLSPTPLLVPTGRLYCSWIFMLTVWTDEYFIIPMGKLFFFLSLTNTSLPYPHPHLSLLREDVLNVDLMNRKSLLQAFRLCICRDRECTQRHMHTWLV